MLYNIIITPIVLVIEFVFELMCRLVSNYGVAIICVSLVVNFLVLPLYRRANTLQEEERDLQKKMEPWVKHIRKTFTGNERYMMLSMYHRQMGYQPINTIKGSLPLLLQIPFFMAAYNYLSELSCLKGISFLFIRDLGAPDAMFSIGSFTVNILPIVMTLLNCVSGFVYTKGCPLRDKLQTYGLAAIFLVILYNSPAGLVLYWTCNQIFSLAKNVCFRLIKTAKEKKAKNTEEEKKEETAKELAGRKKGRGQLAAFFAGGALLTVIMGLLIPSALVGDSPGDFIVVNDFVNPLHYIFTTVCIAAGFFLLWGGVVYYMGNQKGRNVLNFLYWLLAGVFLTDYFFFGKGLGVIGNNLVFEKEPSYTPGQIVINLLAVLLVIAVFTVVWKWKQKIATSVKVLLLIAVFAVSVPNLIRITDEVSASQDRIRASELKQATEVAPLFSLSREGTNVVVIMLDRAMGVYLPFILEEVPKVKEQLQGFTFYPNTISFGGHTIFGAPGLYGGYDYSPTAMNERNTVPNMEKHNESMKLMPLLFRDAGFDVTVLDPPYADYKIGSVKVFDGMEGVKAYVSKGAYSKIFMGPFEKIIRKNQERNFFWYSLFKVSPVFLQNPVYDEGNYFSTNVSTTIDTDFIGYYSVLVNMEGLTRITQEKEDNFLLMQNASTHQRVVFQMPDYTFSLNVDNEQYYPLHYEVNGRELNLSSKLPIGQYHTNIASLMALGNWFDFLRENGVWDNTRILIVSDHGSEAAPFPELIADDSLKIQNYNPLLLVKDFGSNEFVTSEDFMTNADTPSLAMEGIIENPVNPFTGNPVDRSAKEGTLHVTTSHHWRRADQSGTVFDTSDGYWYTVEKGDVLDPANWKREEQQ